MIKRSYFIKIRRYRMKAEAVRLKGGKCIQCGWNGNIAGFHFHHRDPSQKEFGVSRASATNWEKYWAEAEKCELLCATCHAVLHSDYIDLQFLKDVENYNGRDLIMSDIPWKNQTHIPNPKKYKKNCLCCLLVFESTAKNQKFCSWECKNKYRRKCIHPSKEELEKLVNELPMTHIGKKYGVSGSAVKKWCKSYNILMLG